MLTIVLLPGLDGTGTLFENFAIALGSDYRVKIVRYPASEPLGYPELENVARSSLPEAGSFVILGESFSGPIAVALANSCSSHGQCKGLIMCCSFVRNPYPFTSFLKPFINILPISSTSTGLLRKVLLGKFNSETLRSKLAQAIAQVSPSVIRARLRAVIEIDVSTKLAALNIPVLYLRASHDRVVPGSASKIISKLKPDVSIVQLEAPHFLLQAVPDEASQVVIDFIRQVDELENSLV